MVRKSSSLHLPGIGLLRGCRPLISLATVLLLAVLVVRRIVLSEGESGARVVGSDVDLRAGQRVVGGAVIGPRQVGDPDKTRELLLDLLLPINGSLPPVQPTPHPSEALHQQQSEVAPQPQLGVLGKWKQGATPTAPASKENFVPRCLDPNQPLCFFSDDQLVEWRKTRPPRPPKSLPPPPPPPDPEEEEYEQLPVPVRMEWPKDRSHFMRREAANSRLASWRLARGVDSGGRPLSSGGLQRMGMSEEWQQLVGRAQRNGTRMWERVGGGKEVALPGPLPECVMMVGIASSPLHVSRRQACRDTWLNVREVKEGRVMYRFFVGLHRNVSVCEGLLAERRRFGDIVLLPLMDSYYVIAFKTLAIAHYGATKVSTRYVMKTDDDAYVRLDTVLHNLTALNHTSTLLYGNLVRKTAPSRSRSSRWFVSYKEWPQRHFPTWPHGAAYIFSSDIARSISTSDGIGLLPMFKLEDVGVGIWVDGMVQRGVAVEYVDDKSILFYGCRSDFSVAHYQRPRNMHCLHNNLGSGKGAKCCDS